MWSSLWKRKNTLFFYYQQWLEAPTTSEKRRLRQISAYEYKILHSLQSLVRTNRRTKTANVTKDDTTSASHRQKVTVLQRFARQLLDIGRHTRHTRYLNPEATYHNMNTTGSGSTLLKAACMWLFSRKTFFHPSVLRVLSTLTYLQFAGRYASFVAVLLISS